MNAINFPESNTVLGKNQPEYNPLPAHRVPDDKTGRLIFCWQLTFRERLKLLVTGKIWQQVLTFNGPLQPQGMMIEKPFGKN